MQYNNLKEITTYIQTSFELVSTIGIYNFVFACLERTGIVFTYDIQK